MPNLVRLVYVSEASVPFTDGDLATLLRKSQRNNAGRGVTGVLLYAGGHFMQVLEGPADAVTERLAVIGADPRHRNVHQLFCEVATTRLFARWTMGTLSVDAVAPFDRAQVRRLIEWPEDPTLASDRTQVHKLLQNFSHQMATAKLAA